MKKIFLLALVLLSYVLAADINETEPNNDFSTANKITINDVGYGSLYYYNRWKYDKDYWKFTVPENGILKIYTTDAVKNINCYVYDENQNQIAYDNSNNYNVDIKLYVEKGKTYYLDLYEYGWGNTNYKLHFEFTPKDINVTTNERDFKLRKSFNIHGNSKVIGNTVLCHKINGKCVNTDYPNNNLYLSYINLENNSSIYNSSQAEISDIPNDAEILFVGFYTQGDRSDMGPNQLIAYLMTNPSYLISPNGKYYKLYPSVIDVYPFYDVYTFSTFTEVKDLESNSTHKVYGKDINGWWTGANIPTQDGYNHALGYFGAWSMVVVYRYKGETYKNISIFDGYKRVSNDPNHRKVTINVSGFLTPLNGPINSKLSLFVGEGDKAYTGDTLSVDGKYINNTNAFDSTINGFNANPLLTNTFGIDIHNYDIGSSGYNIIKNGQTDANITLTSKQDAYYPNMILFSTDLYIPKVCYDNLELYKDGKLVDSNTKLQVGDIIQLKFNVKNLDYKEAKNVYIINYDNNITKYLQNSTIVKNVLSNNFEKLIDNDLTVNPHIIYNNGIWKLGIIGDENNTFKSTLTNSNYIATIEFNKTIENEGNISFNFYTDYNYTIGNQSFRYNDYLPSCEEFNNNYYATNKIKIGTFNVVNSNFDSDKDPIDVNNSLNDLYTQIVNKPFVLQVVHLDDDNETLSPYLGIVAIDLIDNNMSSNLQNINDYLRRDYVVFFDPTNITDDVNELFTTKKVEVNLSYNMAVKNGIYRIIYVDGDNIKRLFEYKFRCQWHHRYGNLFGNIFDNGHDWGIDCDNSFKGADCITLEENTTAKGNVHGGRFWQYFHMRINYQCLLDNNYSLKIATSRDNFAVRPDKFVIDTTKLPKLLIAGEDYNVTIKAVDFNGLPAKDYNETIVIATDTKSPSINYKDMNTTKGCITGVLNAKNLVFKNGIANIKINYSEIGDLNLSINENNESEYALVDEKDSKNPNGIMIGKNQTVLTFIPYKFDLISTSYNNFNNSNFTYISNDLNMSSVLDLNIKAVNKSGLVTQNYNKNCYAKNININLFHSIPKNNLNILYEVNGTEYNISNNQNIVANNITKDYFNNGLANIPVYINFERKPNTPETEFNFTINDVNVSNIDNVEGNLTLNQKATFKYGFLKVNNINAYDTNEVNSTFKYYYFTNEGWKINKEHNSTVYGDLILSKFYKPSDININIIKNSGKNILNGTEEVNISTSHSLPYSAKIHLAIPSWLWYHPLAKPYKDPSATNQDCLTHPCLKVTYLKSGSGWAGIGRDTSKYSEKNTTVEFNTSKELNATKNTVKKLNW